MFARWTNDLYARWEHWSLWVTGAFSCFLPPACAVLPCRMWWTLLSSSWRSCRGSCVRRETWGMSWRKTWPPAPPPSPREVPTYLALSDFNKNVPAVSPLLPLDSYCSCWWVLAELGILLIIRYPIEIFKDIVEGLHQMLLERWLRAMGD